MTAYVIRRLLTFIPMTVVIALVGFLAMELAPGDYVTQFIRAQTASGNLSAGDQEAALRAEFGLDQPLPVRFTSWFVNFITGDFGASFSYRRPVIEVIQERLGATLIVSTVVFLVSWGIGIPLGVYSATHKYSRADNMLTVGAFIGLGLPDFLIALMLLVAAWSITGEVLTGLNSTRYLTAPWTIERVIDFLKHLWLPVTAVVVTGTAWVMRVMRSNLLNELGKPYITALRAKGVRERTVIWKHAFRNALHPLIGALGQTLAFLINGFTITSVVLDLPTVQAVYLTATQEQDIFLAGTILTLIGFLVLLGTLISDLLLAWLDPRVRFT